MDEESSHQHHYARREVSELNTALTLTIPISVKQAVEVLVSFYCMYIYVHKKFFLEGPALSSQSEQYFFFFALKSSDWLEKSRPSKKVTFGHTRRLIICLKAGYNVFQCRVMNKLVFSPKPWKKISTNPSCHFREKRKNRLILTHFIPKKWRHRTEG